MPFKHVFNYEFVLETIIKWCEINNKKIFDTQLSKFFNDTCNKYYNNYKKSLKTQRIGIIYGCAIALVYCQKRHISQLWNQQELNVIYKTNEIASELMKEVRKEIKKRRRGK